MATKLTIEELKTRSINFINLLGNDLDTTSPKIVGLLNESFAVQHAEKPQSTGGRDAFLSNLGKRIKFANGQVSVQIKHVVAEVYEDGAGGGQCWVYTRKNTPLGCTDSLDMITFDSQGKIILCKDLHSPKMEKWSRFFSWIFSYIWGKP